MRLPKLPNFQRVIFLALISSFVMFTCLFLIAVWQLPPVRQVGHWLPKTTERIKYALEKGDFSSDGWPMIFDALSGESLEGDDGDNDDDQQNTSKSTKISLPPAGSAFSIGFNPQVDGFNFRNYGERFPDGKLTSNEVRELFGDQTCSRIETSGQTETCIPIPENQIWVDKMNDYMAAGHCAGFTIASVRLFNQQIPHDFFTPGSQVTYDIEQNKPAMRQIAKDWTLQVLEEVWMEQVEGTPRDIIDLLIERAQPVDLGIFNRSGAGHSLLAYGLEDMGDGIFHILVYDNNWPGEENYVLVDYTTNTWRYSLAATNPEEDAGAWEGDGPLTAVYSF